MTSGQVVVGMWILLIGLQIIGATFQLNPDGVFLAQIVCLGGFFLTAIIQLATKKKQ